MVERLYLVPIAFGSLAATVIWGRSALRVHRMSRRIAAAQSTEAAALAWSSFRKELHTTIVYGIATLSLALAAVWTHPAVELPLLLLVVPIAMTLTYGQRFLEDAGVAVRPRCSLLAARAGGVGQEAARRMPRAGPAGRDGAVAHE